MHSPDRLITGPSVQARRICAVGPNSNGPEPESGRLGEKAFYRASAPPRAIEKRPR